MRFNPHSSWAHQGPVTAPAPPFFSTRSPVDRQRSLRQGHAPGCAGATWSPWGSAPSRPRLISPALTLLPALALGESKARAPGATRGGSRRVLSCRPGAWLGGGSCSGRGERGGHAGCGRRRWHWPGGAAEGLVSMRAPARRIRTRWNCGVTPSMRARAQALHPAGQAGVGR